MKNIGKADKWIRIVAGLLILTAGVYFKSWWALVGLIPLLTAFTGTCILYLPFRLSTRRNK
jgi:hypothetical protein